METSYVFSPKTKTKNKHIQIKHKYAHTIHCMNYGIVHIIFEGDGTGGVGDGHEGGSYRSIH